jgi:heme A synthase
MVLVGISGAIAALGDTLFPATSLAHGLAQDFSSAAHIFLRLRILHPFIAIAAGALAIGAAWHASATRFSDRQRRLAWTVTGLVALQLVLGVVNVLLLAPVWMQLLHLLAADLLWIALIRAGTVALAVPALARTPRAVARAC